MRSYLALPRGLPTSGTLLQPSHTGRQPRTIPWHWEDLILALTHHRAQLLPRVVLNLEKDNRSITISQPTFHPPTSVSRLHHQLYSQKVTNMDVTRHETFNQKLKNHPRAHDIFSDSHMPSTHTPLSNPGTLNGYLSPTAMLSLEFKRSNCYAAIISFHLIFSFFHTRVCECNRAVQFPTFLSLMNHHTC